MPNWCHDTLTVEGPTADVAAFVQRAATAEAPLSFAQHAPEPSADVYKAMEEAAAVTCDLCGGSGVRPTDAAEAAAQGARWEASFEGFEFLQENARLAVADRPRCNACSGRGKRAEHEAWYLWRTEHWGTKWDATFEGPFAAYGTPAADVSSTVGAHGRLAVAGVAIYHFMTAWSPPDAWLRTAAREHPSLTLTLRYGEPGNDFAGEIVARAGKVKDRALPIDQVLSAEEMWF